MKHTFNSSVAEKIASIQRDRAQELQTIKRLRAERKDINEAIKLMNKVLFTVDFQEEDCVYCSVNRPSYDSAATISASAYVYVDALSDIRVKRLRGAALMLGFEETKNETVATEYSAGTESNFKRKMASGVEIRFGISARLNENATCRKVQVGTKEVPVYELRCD